MAKGKEIILTVEPKGNFGEGIAAEAVLPGSSVAIDAAVEPVGGRHALNAETALSVGIAIPDYLQGKTNTGSIAIGERVNYYSPLPGDELNVLFVASNGAQAIGDEVGPSGADGLFAAIGVGYVIMQTITVGASPAAGTLVWVKKL